MRFKTIIYLLMILLIASCSANMTENHNHGANTGVSHHEPAQTTPETLETNSKYIHQSADPHMRMTQLREPQPGDRQRAEEIADKTRQAIEKYKDYKAALRDGFEILLPEVSQPMYHFNKKENYLEAETRFNPERPTSLLYEKSSNGYVLIGVMYTAPAGMSEDELNKRIPLSITQWHEHINICLPKGSDIFKGLIGSDDKFGVTGSITTKEECDKAGGQFLPRLLGWMIHLYPYEETIEEMWSVEKQMFSQPNQHVH